MSFNYGSPITGTLSATTAIVPIANALTTPATIVLNSSAGGRAIQLSMDGTNFYPAVTPTQTLTGQIYYVLNFPVSAIQFTGAINDTYSIL